MRSNRFIRRRHIIEGKRRAGLGAAQHYFAAARRERASRKVRTLIRRMHNVVLVTPRWSMVGAFLSDLGGDLAIGKPQVQTKLFDLHGLGQYSIPEIWLRLTRILDPKDQETLAHPVGRQGFINALVGLFNVAEDPACKKCLMLHGVELLPLEIRADFLAAVKRFVSVQGAGRTLCILVTGNLGLGAAAIEAGLERVFLPDYESAEAVERLVEYLGPMSRYDLEMAVELVGGVPAFLQVLGEAPSRIQDVCENQTEVRFALGALMDEVRGAVDIVNSEERMAARLEQLAAFGPLQTEWDLDDRLDRAGLLKRFKRGSADMVGLRAPVFAELAANV
ncbi:MAG: hypothetical protein HN348_04985 [Proteobacteria bacterium]|jgi:hypothetical protein|nr:hypothetical protein [Pseudomonadota bacterium]